MPQHTQPLRAREAYAALYRPIIDRYTALLCLFTPIRRTDPVLDPYAKSGSVSRPYVVHRPVQDPYDTNPAAKRQYPPSRYINQAHARRYAQADDTGPRDTSTGTFPHIRKQVRHGTSTGPYDTHPRTHIVRPYVTPIRHAHTHRPITYPSKYADPPTQSRTRSHPYVRKQIRTGTHARMLTRTRTLTHERTREDDKALHFLSL